MSDKNHSSVVKLLLPWLLATVCLASIGPLGLAKAEPLDAMGDNQQQPNTQQSQADSNFYQGLSRDVVAAVHASQADDVKLIRSAYTGSMIPDRGVALLPIQRLVELAMQNSPEIRDAEAAWRASEMDLAEAKGVKWPRLDVTATSAAKQFGDGNPYGNGIARRAGLTATYTLLDGGKSSHQIASKAFLERSAKAKYSLMRNKIAADTVTAYLQIAKYQLLMGAYQGNLERMQNLSAKLKEIVAALPGRRSEATQANAKVMLAQANLADATAKIREFQIQLIKLIGAKVKIHAISQFEVDIPVLPLEEAIKKAEDHPVLLSVEAEVNAAKEVVKVAKSAEWPQLDLQASKMSGNDALGYPDPGQVYVMMKWNIFQGFAGQAAEKASVARASSAEEKRQQAINEIEFKLNSAWADYLTQSARIGNMEILRLESKQVREDYYIQWKDLGRRSLLELLAAENEYLSSDVGLITSKVDRSNAIAKLYAESGCMAEWLVGELEQAK